MHEAFERERAFSANVAHELRTPLAGIHTTIEVALAKPVESSNERRAMERCLTICQQAEVLTENLLVLARLDAKQYQLELRAVSLNSLLCEVRSALADCANQRNLDIKWSVEELTEVTTDQALLTLLVRNLFDNAITYADERTVIEVTSWTEGEVVYVSFCNTTQDLTSDMERHVFDRFWRGDRSRARTGQHAGLGLSLCQQAACALGTQLSVSVHHGRFSAKLKLDSAGASALANPICNQRSQPGERGR